MRSALSISLTAILLLNACTAPPKKVAPAQPSISHSQIGIASWYVDCRTASGERYKASALTAAHRTLPFGTRVRVTNLQNNRSVIVRITDRGPYIKKRIIDVSRAAGIELGLIRSGISIVRLDVLL